MTDYVINLTLTILVISSFLVIVSKNSLHSILFLITSFFSSFLTILWLNCEFLAFFFLIIYLGAIAILFLFVVMMLDLKDSQLKIEPLKFFVSGLFGTFVFFKTCSLLSISFFKFESEKVVGFYINWYDLVDVSSDVESLGKVFYSNYAFQIFVAGLLLYLAVVGVSFLTNKNCNHFSVSTNLSKKLSKSSF